MGKEKERKKGKGKNTKKAKNVTRNYQTRDETQPAQREKELQFLQSRKPRVGSAAAGMVGPAPTPPRLGRHGTGPSDWFSLGKNFIRVRVDDYGWGPRLGPQQHD